MGLLSFISSKAKPFVEIDDISGTYIEYYKDNIEVIGEAMTRDEALKMLEKDIEIAKKLKREAKDQKAEYPSARPSIAH